MDIFPIWKTTFWTGSGDSDATFRILKGNDVIFSAKASRMPDEDNLIINLNKPCQAHIDSILIPSGTNQDEAVPQNAYAEFTLQMLNETSGEWITAYNFAFFNDWSYSDNPEYNLNEPINGHAAPGQILAASYLVTGDTATKCYESNC